MLLFVGVLARAGEFPGSSAEFPFTPTDLAPRCRGSRDRILQPTVDRNHDVHRYRTATPCNHLQLPVYLSIVYYRKSGLNCSPFACCLRSSPLITPHPLLFATWARSEGPVFRSLRSVGYRSTSRSDPRCGARDNGGRPRRCLRADAGIVQARPPRAARGRPTSLYMHWEADKEGSGDFRGPGAPVRDAPIATSRCPASRPPATPSQTT